MLNPRRVMIVDDVRSVRSLVRRALADDPGIEIVGEAENALEAREMMKRLKPDVMTLDVEMPHLRGDVFLKQIMALRPMPVIMLSQLTKANSPTAVRALADGAVDCIQKPNSAKQLLDGTFSARLCQSIHAAGLTPPPLIEPASPPVKSDFTWNGRYVFIGSSTGGVSALGTVLSHFPANGPPVVVAQHIPENFIQSLADLLNNRILPEVRVARDGAQLLPGQVLIVPGGAMDAAVVNPSRPEIRLLPHDPELVHRPSIDVLFESASDLGTKAVGAILTGMGRDGAEGLLSMRRAGSSTIGQDRDTCVVYGMPRAAQEIGACQAEHPIEDIGGRIVDLCRRKVSV